MTTSANHILAGATLGCLMGTTYALLSSPKLKKKLNGVYHDVSERAHDYVDTASDYVQDALDKGQDIYDDASRHAKKLKRKTSKYLNDEEFLEQPRLNMIAGTIGGVLLGAAALYFLSSRDEEEDFVHQAKATYKRAAKQSFDWIDTAKEILHTINSKVNNVEEGVEQLEVTGRQTIDDVIQLANIGLSLWKNIKRR
jgi:gas vesicle protein